MRLRTFPTSARVLVGVALVASIIATLAHRGPSAPPAAADVVAVDVAGPSAVRTPDDRSDVRTLDDRTDARTLDGRSEGPAAARDESRPAPSAEQVDEVAPDGRDEQAAADAVGALPVVRTGTWYETSVDGPTNFVLDAPEGLELYLDTVCSPLAWSVRDGEGAEVRRDRGSGSCWDHHLRVPAGPVTFRLHFDEATGVLGGEPDPVVRFRFVPVEPRVTRIAVGEVVTIALAEVGALHNLVVADAERGDRLLVDVLDSTDTGTGWRFHDAVHEEHGGDSVADAHFWGWQPLVADGPAGIAVHGSRGGGTVTLRVVAAREHEPQTARTGSLTYVSSLGPASRQPFDVVVPGAAVEVIPWSCSAEGVTLWNLADEAGRELAWGHLCIDGVAGAGSGVIPVDGPGTVRLEVRTTDGMVDVASFVVHDASS